MRGDVEDYNFRVMVRWLIEGSRGGPVRARLLLVLRDNPVNPHKLCKMLNLNYRTVLHHLEILEGHGLVVKVGKGYGAPYALTQLSLRNWSIIEESIRRVLGGGDA